MPGGIGHTIPDMRALFSCLLLVFLSFGCSQKSKPITIKNQSQLHEKTPNIAYVVATYQEAWETTLNIIQYDFLLPIEVKNQEAGFFSTVLIKDYASDPPRKYRVSGDLSSNNQETMIKLYKSEQILYTDGKWHTRLSNLGLEKRIVEKIQSELAK